MTDVQVLFESEGWDLIAPVLPTLQKETIK